MKTINWNEAPKEATHHGQYPNSSYWYKVDGGKMLSLDVLAPNPTWHPTIWKVEDLNNTHGCDLVFTPRPKASI